MCCILAVCFFAISGVAQTVIPKVLIGGNPLAIFEAHLSISPSLIFRATKHSGFLFEPSMLVKNNYYPKTFKNLLGYRAIFQYHYFADVQSTVFVGLDIRVKKFAFNNKNTFVNNATGDTIKSFSAREVHTLPGAGVIVGWSQKLGKRKKVMLQTSVGLGVKFRSIRYLHLPDGYVYPNYMKFKGGPAFSVNYEKGTTVYVPAAFRVYFDLR